MSRRAITTLALATVVALAIAPSAAAVVRINKGMFGVSLGQTQKQVKRKLGRPNDVDRERRETHWFYDRRQLMVTFKNRTKRVVSLFTEDPRERTANGVGVGSSEEQVVAGVAGVECSNYRGRRSCVVWGRRAATFFRIEAGTVVHVNILR